MFKSGDCAGQGRCWNSVSFSSEHFQLCEWGHCHLGKLHHCSEMSGSWDARDYSNLARKVNYETNNTPCVSLLEPGIPDCRFLWVFSKQTFSWCKEQRERWFIWPYHVHFHLSDVQVLWVQGVQDEYLLVPSPALILWFLAAVDTPNNVAVFVMGAPMICRLWTQSLQSVNKQKNMHCYQHLSFLKFPLFCPPPVSAENWT
jgi:hypothetical protein